MKSSLRYNGVIKQCRDWSPDLKSRVHIWEPLSTRTWNLEMNKLQSRSIVEGENIPNRPSRGITVHPVNQYRVISGIDLYQSEKSDMIESKSCKLVTARDDENIHRTRSRQSNTSANMGQRENNAELVKRRWNEFSRSDLIVSPTIWN